MSMILSPDLNLALNTNKFLDLDNNFIDPDLGKLEEDLKVKIINRFVLDLLSTTNLSPSYALSRQ